LNPIGLTTGILMKHGYYIIYFSSSALSFCKGIAIAALIPSAAFGKYSLVTALALFSSILVDSGGTYISSKTFPRLWRDGHKPELLFAIKSLIYRILQRSLIALLFGLLIILVLGYSRLMYSFILVIFLALQVALGTVQSSALRASADHLALAKSAFVRSLLVLSLACLGGYFYSVYGALLGDSLGFFLSFIYASYLIGNPKQENSIATTQSINQHIAQASLRGGEPLRLAALIAAVPAYLDRVFVSFAFGVEALGQYSFLMLFVTASSVVAGIGAQKLGPKIILQAYTERDSINQLTLLSDHCKRALLRQILMICLVGLAGVALLLYSPLAYLVSRYEISTSYIMAAYFLSLFSASVYFDWFFMANNAEKYVLYCTLLYSLIFAIAAFISRYAINNTSILVYIIGIIFAKCLQTVLQIFFISKTHPRQLV